jgi:hypothetical protein
VAVRLPESRAWRAVIAVAVFVVAVNVALSLVGGASGPSGPTSSSYATAPQGAAAYADLLSRAGHPVRRLRDRPAQARLDPAQTVVLLDPDTVSRADVHALRSFVQAGGRLIAGGRAPQLWLRALLDDRRLDWQADGAGPLRVVAPVGEVANVRTIDAAGDGSWSAAGSSLPVVTGPTSSLALVHTLGRGRVVLLADASPLQNRLLDQADNARFGVALAGELGRGVTFVESVHGYGRSSGLGALPMRWRWLLGGLLVAGLALVLARIRRLGPPERASRDLPPPRRLYVDAVAALLARTREPEAAAARLRTEAQARARWRVGVDPDDLALLARPAASDDDLVETARAAARIAAGDHERMEVGAP